MRDQQANRPRLPTPIKNLIRRHREKPREGSLSHSKNRQATNESLSTGLVTPQMWRLNVRALLCLLASMLSGFLPACAEVGLGFSDDFTVDTVFAGSRGMADSSVFTVNTLYQFHSGVGDSRLLRVDTRFSGNVGSAASGLFTLNTASPFAPTSSLVGQVNAQGNGLAGTTISTLLFGRVIAHAVTEADGRYVMPALGAGTYDVRASKAGYVAGIWRKLRLEPGAISTVDFILNPQTEPASTQSTSTPTPVGQLLTPTPDHLKVWTGTSFDTGVLLLTDRPTVVMTHGWLSSPTVWAADMSTKMDKSLAAMGREVNLVAWDWEFEANTLLSVATSRTPDQGVALARALISALPENTQPLHFIGHSLGSMVNARAADYLHGRAAAKFPPSRTQMTMLDNAAVANVANTLRQAVLLSGADGLGSQLATTLELLTEGPLISPFPEQAAWMDNYISLVAVPSPRAVNICLSKGALFTESLSKVVDSLHGYSHEWYRETIARPYSSDLGHRYSFEREGEGEPLPALAGAWFEQTSETDSLALSRLSDTEIALCQVRIAASTYSATASGFAIISGNTVKTVGNVVTAVTDKTLGLLDQALGQGPLIVSSVPRLILTTGLGESEAVTTPLRRHRPGRTEVPPATAPAYVWLSVEVPPGAAFMTFDYQMSGNFSDDTVMAAINGTNVFALTGEFAPSKMLLNSGFVDVAHWAGTTAEIFFGILGDTSTNASVAIDGLRFFTIPPPQLAARKTGAELALSWPVGAEDYTLESAPSLASGTRWSSVTNVPALVNFQFSLTNLMGSERIFYRLSKP